MSYSILEDYSENEIRQIVENSTSYTEVLRKVGYYTTSGDNIKTIKRYVAKHNISTEHFALHSSNKKLTKEDVFCKNSTVSQATLRRWFIRELNVPQSCAICGLKPVWNGKPLVLTLDHIDGDNRNNSLNNLRLICPNCDRQLPTFGYKRGKTKESVINRCQKCGRQISPKAKLCKMCREKEMKIEMPISKEALQDLLKNNTFTYVSKKFGVSTNMVRKWCRRNGLPDHSSDYKIRIKKPKKICNRPVYAIDKETLNIVKRFNSQSEASRWLGANKGGTHISRVCRGERKTAYGYIWRYAD